MRDARAARFALALSSLPPLLSASSPSPPLSAPPRPSAPPRLSSSSLARPSFRCDCAPCRSIIEISNKAYEARDAAQSEMAALKSQADKEQEDFEREWKELGKMIEQDRKMKDFMKKEREKLSQQEHRGDMTVEQEQSLKKKVLRGNWGIAKDKASIHA